MSEKTKPVKRTMPKRLNATLYLYVTPANKKFAESQKGKYGSASSFVDSLIATAKAKSHGARTNA